MIARNDSAVAEQLVRDAINDCRRNGVRKRLFRAVLYIEVAYCLGKTEYLPRQGPDKRKEGKIAEKNAVCFLRHQ